MTPLVMNSFFNLRVIAGLLAAFVTAGFSSAPEDPGLKLRDAQSSADALHRVLVDSGTTADVVRLADAGRPPSSSAGDLPVSSGPRHEKKAKGDDGPASPPPSNVRPLSAAEEYCLNAQDATANAQASQQMKSLAQAQADIEKRMNELALKSDEYRQWLKKREDFQKQATGGLLAIYKEMEPQTAAEQLATMSEAMAAAIVSKLPPKSAASILAAMEARRAARLSSVLSGLAEIGQLRRSPNGDKP